MNEFCVYLDWSGWQSEVWIGLLQAAVAGVAIYAAGRLATKQHRVQIAQRVGSVVALLAHTADLVDSYNKDVQNNISSAIAQHWSSEQMKAVCSALQAVPAHDLPDEMLVDPILTAADAVNDLCALLDRLINHAKSGFPISTAEAASFEVYATRVAGAYADALSVDRRYRPLTRAEKKVLH